MGLLSKVWNRIGRRPALRRRFAHVSLGGPVACEGLLPLVTARGAIRFGKDVSFMCRQGPRIVLTAQDGATLTIGDRSFVNQSSSIIATTQIDIGPDVRIGPNVVIHDTAYHEVDEGAGVKTAPIRIGKNAWIGRGSTILAGVTIGDHSVVAAGSMVTKNVSAKMVVAGNPAREIRPVIASDNYVRP